MLKIGFDAFIFLLCDNEELCGDLFGMNDFVKRRD
jgi:hypothetical protein